MDNPIIIIMVIIFILWLLSNRITWIIMAVTGILASIMAMAASVIHFQILAALGFVALGVAITTVFGGVMVLFDKFENEGY